MKYLIQLFFHTLFQASGLGVLCAGIWMQVELHKYLELNADFSISAPYILVATGAIILVISTLACFCTVKGQPSLLYTVMRNKHLHCYPNLIYLNIET